MRSTNCHHKVSSVERITFFAPYCIISLFLSSFFLSVRLTSTEYFDSFMLQVRSEGDGDYDDEYREDEDEYDDDDDRRREEDDEDYDDDDDRRDKSKRDKDKQRRENNTYAGSWTDVPGVAAVLKCGRNRLAAVVDKGEGGAEEG